MTVNKCKCTKFPGLNTIQKETKNCYDISVELFRFEANSVEM